jgi:hypothetical protein
MSATRNTEIANEILNQLGRNMFLAMTGAKNLTAIDSGLKMVLPTTKCGKSRISTKGTIYTLTVTLTPMDTYTVTMAAWKNFQATTLAEEDGIYCDMLRESFERLTGLYTSL